MRNTLPLVAANTFENSIAIQQVMIIHADFGILFGEELSVDVNCNDMMRSIPQ